MKPDRYFNVYELIRDLSFGNPEPRRILNRMMSIAYPLPPALKAQITPEYFKPDEADCAVKIKHLLRYAETGDEFLNLYERAVGI